MEHICKNCGNQYEGNYCSQCGQKAKIGKLTLRSVIDNWAYGLTNCDTGILFTYKELFTRPGHMLADYIRGKRVIYFQPFPMLFITAGLYQLLSQLLTSQEKVVTSVTAMLTFQDRLLHLISTWLHSSMAFTTIISLPFFAWGARCTFWDPPFPPFTPSRWQTFSTWMYHRLIHTSKNYFCEWSDYLFTATYLHRIKSIRRKKYGYNFTEYIFIFTYIACQRLAIGIFLTIPILIYTGESHLNSWWRIGVYSFYFFLVVWDFKQLFQLNIWKAFWQTLRLYLTLILFAFMACLVILGLFLLIVYVGEITDFLPQDQINDLLKELGLDQ